MVILISGASRAGKTLLAQRMLEEHGYPYPSIDHLKMGLIWSGNTNPTPEDDDELTDYLWPIVREMVKTAVENGQSLSSAGLTLPCGCLSITVFIMRILNIFDRLRDTAPTYYPPGK